MEIPTMELVPVIIFYARTYCFLDNRRYNIRKILAISLLIFFLLSLQESALSKNDNICPIPEGKDVPDKPDSLIKKVEIIPKYDGFRYYFENISIIVTLSESVGRDYIVHLIIPYPEGSDNPTGTALIKDAEPIEINRDNRVKIASFNLNFSDTPYIGMPKSEIDVFDSSSDDPLDSTFFNGPILNVAVDNFTINKEFRNAYVRFRSTNKVKADLQINGTIQNYRYDYTNINHNVDYKWRRLDCNKSIQLAIDPYSPICWLGCCRDFN
jgi:hypothetical protein